MEGKLAVVGQLAAELENLNNLKLAMVGVRPGMVQSAVKLRTTAYRRLPSLHYLHPRIANTLARLAASEAAMSQQNHWLN